MFFNPLSFHSHAHLLTSMPPNSSSPTFLNIPLQIRQTILKHIMADSVKTKSAFIFVTTIIADAKGETMTSVP